jgi:ubiquinone biosynthesis protein
MMDYGHMRIRRYREIISVFTKYGFGMLFRRFNVRNPLTTKNKSADAGAISDNAKASVGKRLKLALEELGPTFVKLGQLMSIRQDILPADLIEELKQLQDSVQPFPFSEVKALIETEFNDHLDHIYKEFDKEPLAAASISQVHRAILFSGKEVAL